MTDLQKMEISETEISQARKKLISHFLEVLESEDQATVKTEEIILKALEGWDQAPKTFKARINKLAKFGPDSPKGDSKSRTQAEEKKLHQKVDELYNKRKYKGNLDILFTAYNLVERKYFLEREIYYYTEFEFNQSSDFAVLFSLLADEVRLYRLHTLQAQEPEENYSKQITDAHQRILTGQKALGITKDQRDSLNKKSEGSVSELSIDLDKKLKLREKEKDKEIEKENYFDDLKENREKEYNGIKTITSITDADLKLLGKEMQ